MLYALRGQPSFLKYFINSTVYNAVEDLFLAYQIEDQDRDQGQQVRCKGQVVVCAGTGSGNSTVPAAMCSHWYRTG